MKKQHVVEAFNTYIFAKVAHEEKENLDREIKQLVLDLKKYKIDDDLKQRGEELTTVQKPSEDFMMSDGDFQDYLGELHKRYIKHDPTIKFNQWFVADEHKQLVESERSLLQTAHEYFKQDPRYKVSDNDFEDMIDRVKIREKMLNMICRLDFIHKEVKQ